MPTPHDAVVFLQRTALAVVFSIVVAMRVALCAESDDVRQTWKLLDYLAVDYGGAVSNGAVANPSEFAEMQEFAQTAHAQLSALPPRDGKDDLVTRATQLQAAISEHRTAEDVARLAHSLADALLATYPVPSAPSAPPDLARGATLFAEHCAACHGLQGAGDGPAATGMDPPPVAFTDRARARQRSVFSLYEVTSQGVADTPMVAFQTSLSDSNRWALAFYVGGLSYSAQQRQEGERLWQQDASLRAKIPNLESLTRATEESIAADFGAEKAAALTAYLRSRPEVLAKNSTSSLALARTRLGESLQAYAAGDAKRAATLALSSYLDGFEPVEPSLRAHDSELLARIETAMGRYRSQINAGVTADVIAAEAQALNQLFDQSEAVLASGGDFSTAFLGAFTILLREGVEALLVVVAMISFLRKVERPDALRFVHAGWIGALVAGAVTWAAAAFLVDISGASRELTEGFSSLFAAVVLLAVGIWMHQKSVAGRWQTYLTEQLSAALSRKSAIFLFTLSFVAVYREVFETILFYIALWTRGNGGAILAGLIAGIAALAVITVVLLRTSQRLPISQFFAASSLLIAVLAVVLTGKGVAALQEAGILPVIAVNGPRIDALGIYPSAIGLLLQLAVIACAVIGFLINIRTPRR